MTLGSLWAHVGSLGITLGSRWVTLGSIGIVSGAIVVARPLEQGRAFSPDSYSAVAVTHVRPFDRKPVRFKAFGLCPSNVGLSVVYVSGNMGGRGFSRADDEFRTQVMLNVSTYCAAVPPSVGGEKLEYI